MICKAIIEGAVVSKRHTLTKTKAPIVSFIIMSKKHHKNFHGLESEIYSWHPIQYIGDNLESCKDIEINDIVRIEGDIFHRRKEEGPEKGRYVYNIWGTHIEKI